MAQRTLKKQKNQLSSEKQATPNPPPPNIWPNLPHQLMNFIAKQPNLIQNITSFGGVNKSWKSPSRQYYCTPDNNPKWPQLFEINGKKHEKTRSHIIEIPFHTRKKPSKNRCPGIYFKGHSHGHIVVIGLDKSNCHIWDPTSGSNMVLPPWDTNLSFKICTISSSPKAKGLNSFNVMVLTGTKSPAFAFYRWDKNSTHKREWIIQDCYVKEPYSPGENMILTNVIGFGGKFYALSLQGSVVVIEDVDSCFRITGVGPRRSVPFGVSRRFREYLVELDGEILLVLLVSRKCVDVVEDVEVFSLDISRVLWVKMECIGDRALFLEDECCMGVTSSKVGSKKNCIYFAYHRVDNWWIFDMGSGKISPAENVILY